MPELVRVKDTTTGHEFSWPAHLIGDGVEGVEVIDKPAVDGNGEPVPPKHKTTVDKSAAAKQSTSGQKAESTKEKS
jgi:hypothetical protein